MGMLRVVDVDVGVGEMMICRYQLGKMECVNRMDS
jgi:hypothetical protein